MKNNNLTLYNKKRDFKKTLEPRRKYSAKKGFSYLIQKHAASHLHYDFRLELNKTLKSWAVTKGPSLDPEIKRLAVEVEDHPVAYGSFEGIIPKGQYGGGTLMLWDRGSWQPEGEAEEQLKKGHLTFQLFGERLKGEWSLVRMKKSEKGKNNWLLIKKDDEYARHNDNDKLLKEEITSIVSGRLMEEIAQEKNKICQGEKIAKPAVKKIKKNSAIPEFIPPQLATLSDKMPEGENWVHEIKFDGYRTLARIENGEVKMLTRNGLDWSNKYRSLVEELKKLPVQNAILDGEIVALDKGGRSNFLTLQEILKSNKDEKLQYYLFDILFLDGEDLTKLPLIERKEKLEKILYNSGGAGDEKPPNSPYHGGLNRELDQSPHDKGGWGVSGHRLQHPKNKLKNIFYSEHFFSKGEEFLQKLCSLNYEGVISKLANRPYISKRSKDWLKSKCHKRQEFVIGGFTLPTNGSSGIGALLVGYYEDGKLIYSGKVGTGFSAKSSKEIRQKLEKIKTKISPFVKVSAIGKRGAVYVKPILVCEVEFTQWTIDGALRHPSFQGLREDKMPKEIHKDVPIHLKKEEKISKSENIISTIKITHPDRIIYPKHNLTKLDLVKYYDQVSDYILPHLEDRLISVVCCPQGLSGECFFQRHENIESDFIHELRVNKNDIDYIYIKDKKGLITLIQFGVIEIHIWGSRIDDVNKPDRIVFDLDPSEKVPWKQVVEAAADVKLRLDKLGLESFLKTTGGKGLHVVIPLKRQHAWDVIKPFTKAFATKMESDSPERYIANMSKEKRVGKIFIDYLRNDLTSTAIAPFCARAKKDATVATPLFWEELDYDLDPKKFTIETIFDRLKKQKKDPWEGIWKNKQTISKAVLKEFR